MKVDYALQILRDKFNEHHNLILVFDHDKEFESIPAIRGLMLELLAVIEFLELEKSHDIP